MFSYKFEADRPKWDVIIIGSGLAGVYTALNIEASQNVLLLTKKTVFNSNSCLAQGGIAAVLSDEDSIASHIEDTMRAGHYKNNEDMVTCLVTNGPKEIEQLIKWEVPFDLDDDGKLALAREGAHSVRRIARCGDHTGETVMKHLIARLKSKSNVTIYEHAHVSDLLIKDQQVMGVGCIHQDTIKTFLSSKVVLATGGIGQLFKHTTNDESITGDGFYLAQKAGLNLAHMDCIQFHPTALYEKKVTSKRFLITEALRGEGAVLRDQDGHAFMEGIHPLASLAPRDIVTHHTKQVMLKEKREHVFLDATHMSRQAFFKRFPTIYKYCKALGIDVRTDYIPVVPCAHYLMGGIPVDDLGRTSMKGIFACGEVAYSNVHGDNRLASNSLLECLVFASRIAKTINGGK